MAGGVRSVLDAPVYESTDQVVHTDLELRDPYPTSLVAFDKRTLPVQLHTSTCQMLGLTFSDLVYIRSASAKRLPAVHL